MRILITGSRQWTDVDTMLRAFHEHGNGHEVTIVHGNARGADAIGDMLAITLGWNIERHAADWSGNGKFAGPIRNQAMVDAGADLCLAFYKEGANNIGTGDCVRRAEKAGIEVRKYWQVRKYWS